MLAVSYRERKCGVHRPTLRYERYNVVSDRRSSNGRRINRLCEPIHLFPTKTANRELDYFADLAMVR